MGDFVDLDSWDEGGTRRGGRGSQTAAPDEAARAAAVAATELRAQQKSERAQAFQAGQSVRGKYRAKTLGPARTQWFAATVRAVHAAGNKFYYDLDYDQLFNDNNHNTYDNDNSGDDIY